MWVLEELPPDKKPLGCKWIYKVKYKEDRSLDKYKSRLVANSFAQQGVDYEETFALTVKPVAIMLSVTIEAYFGWTIYHMDVKSTFLNGGLEEEVYMCQPPSFQVAG